MNQEYVKDVPLAQAYRIGSGAEEERFVVVQFDAKDSPMLRLKSVEDVDRFIEAIVRHRNLSWPNSPYLSVPIIKKDSP